MKFKRTLYGICSSAVVLGLTLLFYPQKPAMDTSKTIATVTPSVVTSAAITTISPTSAATKAPTPTPSFVHPLYTDALTTPGPELSKLVTTYIHSFFGNDIETLSSLVTDPSFLHPAAIEKNIAGVTAVEDIKLYAKPGINDIFYVVYATYTLFYEDTNVRIPQLSEYYVIRRDNGTYLLEITSLDSETQEIMANARKSETLMNFAISALIQRYYNACLLGDMQMLSRCVTDPAFLREEAYYQARYAYTEAFSDYNFVIHPGINEFDFIVYVTYKEKIVLIDTPAPSIDSYYISLDPVTNRPSIFLGVTSLDTDAYCKTIMQQDDVQALVEKTKQEMADALLADDDLKDFYNRLTND